MVGLRCFKVVFCGAILAVALVSTHRISACESVIDGQDVSGGSCFDSDCTSSCGGGHQIAPTGGTVIPAPLPFDIRQTQFHNALLKKANGFQQLFRFTSAVAPVENNALALIASDYIFEPQPPAVQFISWEAFDA